LNFLYFRYEKYKSSDGSTRYGFIGYGSVYNFFAYPENTRPRVAQMLILPPFQKQGLAIELLSAIYSRYRTDKKAVEITGKNKNILYFLFYSLNCVVLRCQFASKLNCKPDLSFKLTITVEDPSDDFEVLRDYVDATDCSKLPSFAREKLRKGYSSDMAEEARRVLKMTKVSTVT